MEDKTDKYEKLRNQVVWAVTHYGIVNTDGIIETLRETVLELDTDKLQNTSSNSDYAKCEHDFEPRKTWVHTCRKCGTVQIEKGHFA